MPESDEAYGRGTEPLTARERARLRPGVNAAALERLLAAFAEAGHRSGRRLLVAYFATETTFDDLRGAVAEHEGDMPAADRAALERDFAQLEAELTAEWRARHPAAPPDAPVPPLPLPRGMLRVHLPDGLPEAQATTLRACWAAVERGAAEELEPHRRGPRLCDACGAREATVTVTRGGGGGPDGVVVTLEGSPDDLPPEWREAIDAAVAAQRDRPPPPPRGAAGPRIETHLCESCARQQDLPS